MKKLIYVFLLFISFCFMNVYATTKVTFTVDSNKVITTTETLSVTNSDASDSLVAYKIVDIKFDSVSNTIDYVFTTSFQTYLTSINSALTIDSYMTYENGVIDGTTTSNKEIDRLVAGYAQYVKANSIASTYTLSGAATRTATVAAGSYLIIPSVSVNNVYSVMVGNIIPSVNTDGKSWDLNPSEVVSKKSSLGAVAKTVNGNSFSTGEEFTYTITATVPVYPATATNHTYKIVDTLDPSITIVGNYSIKDGSTSLSIDGANIKNGNTVVGTISVSGQVITFDFDPTKITSTTLTINYNAKLNNNAVIGTIGNANSVVLTYSKDAYGLSTSDFTTDPVVAKVYAYGIQLINTDITDSSHRLIGSQYKIYSDSNLTNQVGTLSIDDNYGISKAYAKGTYYILQSKAPTGYLLNKTPIELVIGEEGILSTDTTNAPLLTNNERMEGFYFGEIQNKKSGILPFTGSIGTYIFTIIGSLIILFVMIIYVISNKNKGNIKKSNDEIEIL